MTSGIYEGTYYAVLVFHILEQGSKFRVHLCWQGITIDSTSSITISLWMVKHLAFYIAMVSYLINIFSFSLKTYFECSFYIFLDIHFARGIFRLKQRFVETLFWIIIFHRYCVLRWLQVSNKMTHSKYLITPFDTLYAGFSFVFSFIKLYFGHTMIMASFPSERCSFNVVWK